MRKLLLICLVLSGFAVCYGQEPLAYTNGTTGAKNTLVKQQQGTYKDPKSGNATGQYTVVYVIDTVQNQLRTVSVTTYTRGQEFVYRYFFEQNQLRKAVSGRNSQGVTLIQNIYEYDDEDRTMKANDLETFSETDEKYALLKESKTFLSILKK